MRASAEIFDRDHLDAQTGCDLALQDEILVLFVRQSSEILTFLQDDTTLPRTRADLAHKLIGSARAVGAFRLADAAEILEARLRADDAPQSALAELSAIIDATHAEISRHPNRPRGR